MSTGLLTAFVSVTTAKGHKDYQTFYIAQEFFKIILKYFSNAKKLVKPFVHKLIQASLG